MYETGVDKRRESSVFSETTNNIEGSSDVAVEGLYMNFKIKTSKDQNWSSKMIATWSAMAQPAMDAGTDCAKRMPFFMHPMCMATAAAASMFIIGTGVLTSVSLFVSLFIVVLLLLVSILVVTGLILSGLTGLVHVSLVGLIGGLVPSTAQGD